MTIVFASSSPLDPFLVVGSQHLAREMARMGHQVTHIGPPITPWHRLNGRKDYRVRFEASLRAPAQIAERLISITPLSFIPWQIARQSLSPWNFFVQASNLKSTLEKAGLVGEIDVLLVDDPRFVCLENILRPRSLLYRATDLYADFKSDETFTAAERLLLPKCSGVIGTSQPVLHHLLTLKPGLPCLLLENGVEYSHFATPVPEAPELKNIPHPRAVYVGALDARFNVGAIQYLARHFEKVHFVIIGPGSELPRLQALAKPNLHVLGPKPYASVPRFLQHCEIGLLPLTTGGSNPGRSPMKLYEYGAAGLKVLATSTPELARRNNSFVRLYQSYDEAATLLQDLLDHPSDRLVVSEACRALSWEKRTETLLDFIQETSFANN